MPKVSVIIALYNCADFIEQAIESVLDQTFQDFEIIIVDNCSTDKGFEIIQKYKYNKKISIYQNTENIGMARNWNQAILFSRGEYIKPLCADDFFDKDLLNDYCEILDSYDDVTLVFGSRRMLFPDGVVKELPIYFEGKRNGHEVVSDIIQNQLNPIGEPTTVMFRRKSLNVGLFNTDMHWLTDIDYWLRLCSIGEVYSLPRSYSVFRQSDQQGTVLLRKSGANIAEERNFIYYNYFIRNNSAYSDPKIYRSLIRKHIFNNIRRIDYASAKKYLSIWPFWEKLITQLKVSKYFFLKRMR